MDPPSTASLDFRRLDPCACAGGAENRRPSSTCLHVEDLMKSAFTRHWPEYGMEALRLGLFMLSANGFAVLLFHPASPVVIGEGVVGRVFMGAAMGLTAVALIYSPWGQRSGAHF